MDMEVYNRWAPVVVVHYVVVGQYAAPGHVAALGTGGTSARAMVRDRVDFTFDWDQSELQLVGTPVIKNYPTTIDSVTAYAGCGTPRLEGAYEHVTYLALTNGTGHLNTEARRDMVAARVDQNGDTPNSCGATSVSIPAKSETTPGMFLIAPPQYYAMPASGAVTLSADKKSIIMSDKTGWTWTYTLTPVR
jgi:hypothetical protein